MENDIITIYADDIEIAQNLCSSIRDNSVRSRSVANVLATKLAERYFKSKNIQTDSVTGLHNIPKIVENLDIADIYVKGSYVDVRVYFSSDELSVPKFHFDLGISPAVYMFIKLNSDLSGFMVSGFMVPDNIDKSNLKEDYYFIDEKRLVSFYDIEHYLMEIPDNFSGSKENLYEFVDGTIDKDSVANLLQTLVTSANARTTLIKAFKTNSLSKFVSVAPQEVLSNNDNNHNEQNNELNDAKETDTTAAISEHDLEKLLDDSDSYDNFDYSTEITPNSDFTEEDGEQIKENGEQIDSLFTGKQEGIPVAKKKKSSFSLVIFLLLIAAIGYFAYTKFAQLNENNSMPEDNLPSAYEQTNDVKSETSVMKEEAMPNETVDAVSENLSPEEASPVAIPAIEQHLDASVLVANLKVDWEVPAGYASNTAAKRYLVKLGKIIQLNLKSELLLLTKPPISNKITVELKYNSDKSKFEIVGLKDSSGEKTVDETIVNTIKSALNQSTGSNIESFGRLQGNPVLIIHL